MTIIVANIINSIDLVLGLNIFLLFIRKAGRLVVSFFAPAPFENNRDFVVHNSVTCYSLHYHANYILKG